MPINDTTSSTQSSTKSSRRLSFRSSLTGGGGMMSSRSRSTNELLAHHQSTHSAPYHQTSHSDPYHQSTKSSSAAQHSGTKPSRRMSFGSSFRGSSSSTFSIASTATASSRKLKNSLLKLPKKLLSAGKYPKTKIVKDSITMLDDEIRVMTQDAPFIDCVAADDSICLLDRKEVIVGELLGEGQFAQVYNVNDLQLRENDKLTEELSLDDQTRRQAFVDDFHSCPTNHKKKNCHRYAIKHLKRDLLVHNSKFHRRRHTPVTAEVAPGDTLLPIDQQFQLAAADLLVEALYMSRLQHPHILKVRGMALGGTASFGTGRYDSYFLILDKLRETLDQRIRKWRHTMGQPQETQLCLKTYYAYQMAQALEFLHWHRIIYRDLKPSNIGFKEMDDGITIFDFGLCRELPKKSSDSEEEVYFMTAAGTHRYMAVEVHQGKQYNCKADTYSWSMVYYELLAQEAPFLNFSEEDHQKLVCERQHRPKHFMGCVVPMTIQKLLGDAWAHALQDRLTMAEVVTRLEDILVTTFQRTLKEGPGGVKVIEEFVNSAEVDAEGACTACKPPTVSAGD